jgi:hypothetical protein
MFLGKVDALGSESVQTKFFILGVPLVPLASHYVLEEQVAGVSGFEIPLHGKSVLLGYIRIYAWIAALLCGVFAYMERHDAESLWVATVIFGVLAVFTTFALGGLSKPEKFRRALLRSLTGVGAPPELLPSHVRTRTAERLAVVWDADNEGQPWQRAIESGKTDPILFALAEYDRNAHLAAMLLDRLQRSDSLPQTGPYR